MMAQLWRLHRHVTAMAAWVGGAPGGLNAKSLNRRQPGREETSSVEEVFSQASNIAWVDELERSMSAPTSCPTSVPPTAIAPTMPAPTPSPLAWPSPPPFVPRQELYKLLQPESALPVLSCPKLPRTVLHTPTLRTSLVLVPDHEVGGPLLPLVRTIHAVCSARAAQQKDA